METINSSVKVSLKYTLRYLLYAESCLSGRAYIGEGLIQIWLKYTSYQEVCTKNGNFGQLLKTN